MSMIADPDREEEQLIVANRGGVGQLCRAIAGDRRPTTPVLPIEFVRVVMMILDADRK